jgi:hypothetical protein
MKVVIWFFIISKIETLAASATNNKLINISYESDNSIFDNKTNNNTWRGQRAIGVV